MTDYYAWLIRCQQAYREGDNHALSAGFVCAVGHVSKETLPYEAMAVVHKRPIDRSEWLRCPVTTGHPIIGPCGQGRHPLVGEVWDAFQAAVRLAGVTLVDVDWRRTLSIQWRPQDQMAWRNALVLFGSTYYAVRGSP